jgi:hypothetical protein
MAIHIWNFLSVGLNPEFKIEKRQFWLEAVPGFAFKAVWFGRQRKRWFHEKEYLVLYRNDVFKESHCHIAWVPVSTLTDRFALRIKIRDKTCRDKELNDLFDTIINSAVKDAYIKNIE